MHFTLFIISKEDVREYPLPSANDRKIKIPVRLSREEELSFEVYDNVWSIIGSGELTMDGKKITSHRLADGDIIRAFLGSENEFVIQVFERISRFTEYTKYDIKDCSRILIGRNEDSDIFIDDKFIGKDHAEIIRRDNSVYIVDKSINGIFVNQGRVTGEYELKPFDIIYTIGFKMVFLGDVLAMNRQDIVKCKLTAFDESQVKGTFANSIDDKFTRSPRSIEPLYTDAIEIEAPPAPQRQRRQPLIFVVGPSVTMPLPILMSTLINSQLNSSMSGSKMYLATIASVVMSALLGTGWAIAHQVYNKKENAELEAFRVEAYKEYIKKNTELIEQKQSFNESILLTQYLASEIIADKLRSDHHFIWNRNIRHDDFLRIRTGIGTIDFQAPINVPKQRFSMHKDNMSELPYNIAEKYKYIHNSVTQLDLLDKTIVGLIGDTSKCNEVLNSIIIQITALHSYTDVKLAVIFNDNETDDLSWVRFLPHTLGEDMKTRMAANDKTSRSNVLYDVNEILRSRIENEEGNASALPHYIIICTDKELLEADSIERYYSSGSDVGVTFILRYNEIEELPNECHTVIECTDSFTGFYDLEKSRSVLNRISLDMVKRSVADSYARTLSRFRVRAFATGEIPDSIDYFDMIGIGNLSQWELIKHYKENRAYEGISSFLGIGMGGKPVYLDIHEKKYGPHGLVAGTTGSGKSETLQTFILSLTLNYHPEEVSFILIDFKGGGMANVFEGMPHIAGTITNLEDSDEGNESIDPNLTRRALVSIKSENKRRQTIFKKYGLNKIDDYMKLYREGKAEEPLPHLVIISDEFAELKHQQPEFIKELVSVAAIGRSLGVHLILATQKPGNSVDENIKANSRFKLCLRVQDKQDSMEMLRRPDAAFLKHTGRAYLQIGNDEVYEQFQTGYSGGAYIPKAEVSDASEEDAVMITIDGRPALSKKNVSDPGNEVPTEIRSAIDYIKDTCQKSGIGMTRQLWLPVIPDSIYHDDTVKEYSPARYGISAVYGIVDYPEVQKQFAAVIDFSACSNLMITSLAGTGKTTLLQTLMYSLANNYTPEDVNFYILDFGGTVFRSFDILPCTGIVASSEDNEAVTRTLRFIEGTINERRQMFNSIDVGSYNEYIKHEKIPLILLVIDNFVNFSEQFDKIIDDFTRITRECTKYGIQVIITCNHLSDVRSRLRQNFNNIITGILGDKSEYREAWSVPAEFMPVNLKGRGLTLVDGRLLEYQTALPVSGKDEKTRNENIKNIFTEISERYNNYRPAHRIQILPREQTNEDFVRKNALPQRIPIGYRVRNIDVHGIDLNSAFCYAVSESGTQGISLVLTSIYRYTKLFNIKTYTIKLRDKVKIHSSMCGNAVTDGPQLREFMKDFFLILKERTIIRDELRAEHPDEDIAPYMLERVEKIFLIIDSFSEFQTLLASSPDYEDIRRVFRKTFQKGEGVGLYIFAGFDQELYSQMFFSEMTKAFISHKAGIHLGGCYDKQKLFDVQMPITKMSQPDDFFSGYTEEDGKGFKIFIPFN